MFLHAYFPQAHACWALSTESLSLHVHFLTRKHLMDSTVKRDKKLILFLIFLHCHWLPKMVQADSVQCQNAKRMKTCVVFVCHWFLEPHSFWHHPRLHWQVQEAPFWQWCHSLHSHHHSVSSVPLSLPLSACFVLGLRLVLASIAEVGLGLERLVLRLCLHITTADCSLDGWDSQLKQGLLAHAGFPPCSTCLNSESPNSRKGVCVCYLVCVWDHEKMFRKDLFLLVID